jgi:stearoyl-CoA desaturase (delta-9 desaturase)
MPTTLEPPTQTEPLDLRFDAAVLPLDDDQPNVLSPADRRVRMINLGAVIVPFIALGIASYLAWGHALNWTQVILFFAMMWSTAFGITVGYHRLATHRAFATGPVLRYTFCALGSMAAQGPVIEWAGAHRKHHQHSDDHDDPHSPHAHARGTWGSGILGVLRGFYHSHMGWLFIGRQKGLGRYTRDLQGDPVLVAASLHFKYWVVAGLIIPAIIGGLVTMSWSGAFLGFLWGGLVRAFFVHHVTWSVNSVCHLWGTRPFKTTDESRNNAIVGVLAMGEGWHNNHHAFPTSARHGLRWWQFDPSWILIRTLALLGLAWRIKLPDPERLTAKLRSAKNDPATTA